MACTTCNDSILNPEVAEKPFCINCAEAESKCGLGKFPADCVIYHIDDETPSKLTNIGAPNKASVSQILEAIDKLVGLNFNTPLKAIESKTILFSTSGTASHTLTGSVKLSTSLGNLLQEKGDGLYVGTSDLGKVRVTGTGSLAYLSDKVVGDSDGISSISVAAENDLLKLTPSLSVENLLTEIRTNFLDQFNQLLSVSNTSNSSGDTVVSISTKLAPYIAYPYHGSLTNFDNTGKGVVANGYDKIYICNGDNGTPDYRGRSPIGANVGVPGGQLDGNVNPANMGNLSISINQKIGSYSHQLSANELATHTHTLKDDGHFHYTVSYPNDEDFIELHPDKSINFAETTSGTDRDYHLVGNSATPTMGKTDTKGSNITINTNDTQNIPHNNTHPTIGTVFIMYIP